MITTLPLALAAAVCVGTAPSTGPVASGPAITRQAQVDSTYRALYEGGKSFGEFVAAADSRKAQWEANFAKQPPDALASRLGAAVAPGWKLLVVTRAGCSDSVNSIPYLAALLARLPSIEMRLVDMNAGMKVLEAHRTPDGRPATPTVILLDEEFTELGCWIERPAPLLAWMAEQKDKLSTGALFEGKMNWYDDDAGVSSLEEIVQMVEAAAQGKTRCSSGGIDGSTY